MKPKKVTQKDLLFLTFSVFIVTIAWIGFSLYHAYVTSTISEDLQMQIVPIQARFDTATIDKLKTRKKILPVYEFQISSPSAEPSPTQTPLPTETPTPSGTIPTITGPTPSIGGIVGQ